MSKLGISLYPNVSNNYTRDKEYLELAKQFGFTRLFMCLLNVEYDELESLKKISMVAKEYGYEIIFDISPSVIEKLNIQDHLLEFVQEIGGSGIRMDESFDGIVEAKMTQNVYDLKIEINASVDNHFIDSILMNKPNLSNLIACHNYYPLKYTGLGFQHFLKTSRYFKQKGISVAAFVSSNQFETFGPWAIQEGLCTLEIHRGLAIDLQVRHLLATQFCDDILIGNAYASKEELKACQEAVNHSHILHLISNENSIIEDKIIDEHIHELRKDKSDFVIRSTLPRIKYKKYPIYEKATSSILHRGDVIILNDKIERYKGELQIALKDLENDGRYNLVGKIPIEEHLLLDYINTWNELTFIRKE